MKIHLVVTLLFGLFSIVSIAQVVPPEPVEYTDQKVNEGKYSKQSPLTDKIIRTRKDGLYGFVRNRTEVLIPIEYTSLPRDFAPIMVAQKHSGWGLINHQHRVLIPFKYNKIIPFFDLNVYLAKDFIDNKYQWGLLNEIGKEIIPIGQYELQHWMDDQFISRSPTQEKTVIFNAKGEVVFEGPYSFLAREGDYYEVVQGKKHGLIKPDNTEILPCKYQSIEWVVGDLAAVKKYNSPGKTLVSLKDRTEKETPYTRINRPDEFGNMIVRKRSDSEGGKNFYFGLVNQKLKVLIPAAYVFLFPLKDLRGYYIATQKKGVNYLFDPAGKQVAGRSFATITAFVEPITRPGKEEPEQIIAKATYREKEELVQVYILSDGQVISQ